MHNIATLFALSRRRFATLFAVLVVAATTAPLAFAAEKIPFTAATVEEKAGAFTLEWDAPADVTQVNIFTGSSPGEIKRDMAIATGGAHGKITVTLPALEPAAPRRYFEFVPNHGESLIIADRGLHLATAPNFRDVGGYRAADGRWVRMGLLYRSDQLNLLSDADLGVLHNLGVRLVCDLRTDAERKGPGADRLPRNAKPLVADVTGDTPNSILAGILKNPDSIRNAGPAKMEKEMASVYRQLVSTENAQKAYHDMFQNLADPILLPGVFHCTAGKDRTGWATAVFLSIMGVPRETIIADYLASNQYLTDKNARLLNAMPDDTMRAAMKPLTDVRAVYIEAAFDEVTKRFGTIENYVTQGLKLDVQTLRLLRRLYSTG